MLCTSCPPIDEDKMANFTLLLAAIDPKALVSLATHVRSQRENTMSPGCELVSPPLYGAYNLVHVLQFIDGTKYVIRSPINSTRDLFTPSAAQAMRSEALTMRFIKKHTNLPLPDVYDFDTAVDSAIGAPYIMMSFEEGLPVSDAWFDTTGQTPLQIRRRRILETVAEALAQLHAFSFEKIGALEFDPTTDLSITNITAYPVLDQIDQLTNFDSGQDSPPHFCQMGPYNTTHDFFFDLVAQQHEESDRVDHIGRLQLLRMMIESIPPSVPSFVSDVNTTSESFVLVHPDFDSQNFLVAEDGTLTCILDWDGIHTVPRCLGYSRCPGWITRDWDPIKYGYGMEGYMPENSPEELEEFRLWYGDKMSSLVGEGDYIRKSHLFEALWVAVGDPFCMSQVVHKICRHCMRKPLFELEPDAQGTERIERRNCSGSGAVQTGEIDGSRGMQNLECTGPRGSIDERDACGAVANDAAYAVSCTSEDPDLDFRVWYYELQRALGEGRLAKEKVDLIRCRFQECFAVSDSQNP